VSAWDSGEPAWFDPLRDPHGPGWHLDRPRFDQMLRGAACFAAGELRMPLNLGAAEALAQP
jgi:hypothetical protein